MGMTINEAAHQWVGEFNAIPRGMIEKLMLAYPEDWREITAPVRGDVVDVCNLPQKVNMLDCTGEIRSYDLESDLYCIELDGGTLVSCCKGDFEVQRLNFLPYWSTMWSFRDSADDRWLSDCDGIRKMTECGFRIFENDEFGYFFGIDGAGYSFYETHWEPLYKARGLRWHDEKTEHEYQMLRNGYEKQRFCGKLWWCNGYEPIEKVGE